MKTTAVFVAIVSVLTLSCEGKVEGADRLLQRPAVIYVDAFGVRHYRHASTLQQGVLDATANLVGAWGQSVYLYNQALIAHEIARKARIANRLNRIRGWYEAKQIRRRFLRRNDVICERIRDHRAATVLVGQVAQKAAAIQIEWPMALLHERFARSRLEIEGIVDRHDPRMEMSAEDWRRMRNTLAEMQAILRSFPLEERSKARRWLRRLIAKPACLLRS